MQPQRNLDGLRRVAKARTDDAEKSALAAIRALQKRGVAVNFATVATEAGCSRTYLYNHPDLRDHIRRARETKGVGGATARPVTRTESSKDRIIDGLRTKIERLEEELTATRGDARQLRGALERALGEAQYWKEQAKRSQR